MEVTQEPTFGWGTNSVDGILGLGFDKNAANGLIPPPFYNLMNHNLLERPMFGYYLGKSNPEGDQGGMLSIGCVHGWLKKGRTHFINLLAGNGWIVGCSRVRFGRHNFDNNHGQALSDSITIQGLTDRKIFEGIGEM